MRTTLIAAAGLALFTCLVVAAVYLRKPPIEQDLTDRVTQRLDEHALGSITVTLDGRDVTLGGTASRQGEIEALRLASAVWGVRAVENAIEPSIEAARVDEQLRQAETARRARTREIRKTTRLARQAAAGLTEVATATCQQLFDEALASRAVEFDAGSAVIDPGSLALLQDLSVTALRCPQARIEIVGHTEATGEQQADIDLSFKRAEAVATMLVQSGVDGSRLSAVGYGSAFPLSGGDTPQSRVRNERIDIKVNGRD